MLKATPTNSAEIVKYGNVRFKLPMLKAYRNNQCKPGKKNSKQIKVHYSFPICINFGENYLLLKPAMPSKLKKKCKAKLSINITKFFFANKGNNYKN